MKKLPKCPKCGWSVIGMSFSDPRVANYTEPTAKCGMSSCQYEGDPDEFFTVAVARPRTDMETEALGKMHISAIHKAAGGGR